MQHTRDRQGQESGRESDAKKMKRQPQGWEWTLKQGRMRQKTTGEKTRGAPQKTRQTKWKDARSGGCSQFEGGMGWDGRMPVDGGPEASPRLVKLAPRDLSTVEAGADGDLGSALLLWRFDFLGAAKASSA